MKTFSTDMQPELHRHGLNSSLNSSLGVTKTEFIGVYLHITNFKLITDLINTMMAEMFVVVDIQYNSQNLRYMNKWKYISLKREHFVHFSVNNSKYKPISLECFTNIAYMAKEMCSENTANTETHTRGRSTNISSDPFQIKESCKYQKHKRNV